METHLTLQVTKNSDSLDAYCICRRCETRLLDAAQFKRQVQECELNFYRILDYKGMYNRVSAFHDYIIYKIREVCFFCTILFDVTKEIVYRCLIIRLLFSHWSKGY